MNLLQNLRKIKIFHKKDEEEIRGNERKKKKL
jgi:hypothetical protein